MGAVVVIDVLRAFSTAAYALHWGAAKITLVDSIRTAMTLQSRVPDALTLTDGARRDGIDLVNSPAMLAGVPLDGKSLIMKTTNGTVAALAARHAAPLLCASFVNAHATADYLRATGGRVFYLPSGGDTADEDRSCAEYIAALVADPATDAAPFLARAGSAPARARLDRRAAAGHTGTDPQDVAYCLSVEAAPVVLVGAPVASGVEIRRPSS